MSLLYSDVEEDLRGAVRSLLADRCAPASVLARCETGEPYDLGLWRTLTRELGVTSLHVPERLGGQGASLRETAVVMEELGRAVAPVPYLGHSVLAVGALLAAESSVESRVTASLVARLAGGELIAALAVPLSMWPGADFPTSVRASGDGVLTGRASAVADAFAADLLVAPALGPDGPSLYAVTSGFAVTPAVSLDLTRPVADVVFDGAAGELVASGDAAVAALSSALSVGAGLLAAEQLGVAEQCLESTVAYLKERRQFGRPVGSFQALKHRLADLWHEIVTARAAARHAADALAVRDPDAPVAVAVAQSHCAAVAVHAAEECVQLHGGIGMTWEHPAHLWLKRAKADEIALGTPGRHRAALAPLVNLPGPS
ncbi:MAG: acyl-CoA dehydrogenase [Micromonosporaceae bacterium]|nr:acyl-CoA dehydrogenase [Micromonosporaceae bacterium]